MCSDDVENKLPLKGLAQIKKIADAQKTPLPWYQKAKVISSWPLSKNRQEKFGVQVNGVWTWYKEGDIEAIHKKGNIAVSSLQLFAGESKFMKNHPNWPIQLAKIFTLIQHMLAGTPGRKIQW